MVARSAHEGRVSILLVDDAPANLLTMRAILDRPNYELVQTQSGWHLRFLGKNQGIVWSESAFRAHPQSGLPRPNDGNDALRTHAMDKNAHTQAYQEVAVLPSTAYRASVWVQPVDVRGKGFGKSPGDSAGFCIEELDAADKLLVAHPNANAGRRHPDPGMRRPSLHGPGIT